MPEKRTTAKKSTAKKSAAREAVPRKTLPAAKRAAAKGKPSGRGTPMAEKAAAAPIATAATPRAAARQPVAPTAASPGGACPRCGSARFAPEQRIRAEGSRTVRYAILVCERGHTFAKPVGAG